MGFNCKGNGGTLEFNVTVIYALALAIVILVAAVVIGWTL